MPRRSKTALLEPLQDLRGVHIEVSVLGPLVEFPATSYDDVVARLPREGAVVSGARAPGHLLAHSLGATADQ